MILAWVIPREDPLGREHMFRKWLISVLAGLAMFGISGTASAALIHDITLSGGATGSGQITFNALTGSSPSGVTAFSLSGTGPLGAFEFSIGQIQSINWDINDLDWSLTTTTFDTDASSSSGLTSCLVLGTSGGFCSIGFAGAFSGNPYPCCKGP